MTFNSMYLFFRFKLISIIRSIFWLVFNFNKFSKHLNTYGLSSPTIINLYNWHDGFHYFTAYNKKKKVFIKTDLKIGLLENEINVYNVLKGEVKKLSIPNLICYSLESNYPFLALEFVDAKTLDNVNFDSLNYKEKKQILKCFLETAIIFDKFRIVHRDIKLNNFMCNKNEYGLIVYIIDFYFAITNDPKKIILNEIPKKYAKLLKTLGEELKPNMYTWDDAHSLYELSRIISLSDTNEFSEELKNHIGKNVYSLSESELQD